MEWRYLAQNILTGEWLDTDLPLTRDAEQPVWGLSGAGSFTATIKGDHPWLQAHEAGGVLGVWSTALYAERDGEIVWGGLVHESDWSGPDWRVEAFAFTSYANNLPYTGGYQKIVDKDPGVVWAKLWQHVQSQPDGNLGLQFVMPDQLGPNIGTKDEPYELAWWEAKDVGSELQALASEAPFDYVESHEWAVPLHGATGLPTVKIAYGNLEGGYDGSDKKWMKERADDQTDLIASLGMHVFVAVELHEETSKAMPDGAHKWFVGRMRARNGPQWTLAEGNGGNHAIYDAGAVRLVATTTRSGIDDPSQGGSANLRSATLWLFEHIATGYRFPVSGRHLHADTDRGTSRRGSRLAEARDVDQLDGAPGRYPDTIACGDFNSYSEGDDEVYGIIRAETGLETLKRRAGTFPGSDLNSFGKKKKGRHIDSMLSNPRYWDLAAVRGVPTRKLSDHQLWLYAEFTPRGGQAGVTLDPSRKVRHIVELAYPRAGRRRLDLRFVQGENVLEVVQPKQSGDEFANGVVTLGKGEGSKTIRGESVVRDGRLRRVTVYTDKLASTKARCESLAKRERGYRGLGLEVDSIVVDGAHPSAPMGSWALGDDIPVEYDVPHLGRQMDFYRIMAWSLVTDTTARLTLRRSDAFTYGPVVPPPSDDTYEDEQEVGDR